MQNAIDKLAMYEDAEEQGRLVIVVRCSDCIHFKRFQYRTGPVGYCNKETEAHGFCYERWEDDFCMSGRTCKEAEAALAKNSKIK